MGTGRRFGDDSARRMDMRVLACVAAIGIAATMLAACGDDEQCHTESGCETTHGATSGGGEADGGAGGGEGGAGGALSGGGAGNMPG
jgi:hypothetical protein